MIEVARRLGLEQLFPYDRTGMPMRCGGIPALLRRLDHSAGPRAAKPVREPAGRWLTGAKYNGAITLRTIQPPIRPGDYDSRSSDHRAGSGCRPTSRREGICPSGNILRPITEPELARNRQMVRLAAGGGAEIRPASSTLQPPRDWSSCPPSTRPSGEPPDARPGGPAVRGTGRCARSG
jgi:hypothetical protein